VIPIEDSAAPIRDAQGKVAGAVMVFHDVSVRRRIEDALRASEERLRGLAAIVESSDDAIISKTLDGVITTWNHGAERIFGYTTEEVVGKPVTLLIPPDQIDEEPSILQKLRRGERIEFNLRPRPGCRRAFWGRFFYCPTTRSSFAGKIGRLAWWTPKALCNSVTLRSDGTSAYNPKF